jgi:hypothetical protein
MSPITSQPTDPGDTNRPTGKPTSSKPTSTPTSRPTIKPTHQPSGQPTVNPTSPTSFPSNGPTTYGIFIIYVIMHLLWYYLLSYINKGLVRGKPDNTYILFASIGSTAGFCLILIGNEYMLFYLSFVNFFFQESVLFIFKSVRN